MHMKQYRAITLLLMVLLSSTSEAFDFEVDGLYYNIVNIENLTCKLTHGDTKYSGDIVVPNEVRYKNRSLYVIGIDNNAFLNCDGLTSVEFPSTIQTIGNNAFKGCTNLNTVQLPEQVVIIGSYAFAKCTSLCSIYLGSQLITIGDEAFFSCTNISNIILPQSTERIGDQCFAGCLKLLSIDLPEGLSSIGVSAFENCCLLKKIDIPFSLKTIRKKTFKGCCSIERIIIPSNIDQIEDSCFMDCSTLNEVIIEDGINYLNMCDNRTKIRVSNQWVGSSLFKDTKIENIYVGRNIGTAFSGLKSLLHIEFGPMVNSIVDRAFVGLVSLKELTIPSNIEKIGDNAFSYCGIEKLCFEDGDSELQLKVNLSDWDIYCAHTFDECPINDVYYGRNIVFGSRAQNPDYEGKRTSFFSSTLKNVVIGEYVEQISPLLYHNEKLTTSLSHYPNLKSITFGSLLSFIPHLSNNKALDEITMTSFKPQNALSFSNAQYLNMIVNIPIGSKTRYEQSSDWKNFWNLQEKEMNVKPIVVGDVNGDHELDNKDANAIVQYILEGKYIKEADLNNDNKVNAVDIVLLNIILNNK